jgi:hypothetical protein
MQWDKTCSEVAKETADEHQVLTSQVKEAVDIYFLLVMRKIRSLEPVVVPKLGLFSLSPWKTSNHLWKIMSSHRKHEASGEGMTYEETVRAIQKYWPIHQKAIKHRIRNGKKYRIRLAKLKEQDGN